MSRLEEKIAVITRPNRPPQGEQVTSFSDCAAGVTPFSRIGTDAELTKVVAFLASDERSFMSGAEFFVDGGLAQVWVRTPFNNQPTQSPGETTMRRIFYPKQLLCQKPTNSSLTSSIV